MMLSYTEATPEVEAYFQLFQTTGWNDEYRLDPSQLAQALSNSWYMISAYDGEQLVGFGRIISDGMLHALVVDVIVAPEYQHRGTGTVIMQRLLARCRQQGVKDVQLFCATGKAPFYRRLGFEDRPQDAPGMQLANS